MTRVLATKNAKDDKWAGGGGGGGQYLHDRYGAHPALLRCRLRGAAHGMDDFGATVDRRQRTGPLYFVYDSHRESADAWGSLLGHPHEEGAAAGEAGRSIYKGDAAVLRKGRRGGADVSQQPLLTWWTIFSTRSTATACMAYVYTALIFIIYDEMFPVFGKTDVAQGGLGFTAEDIGSALSVGGVVLIIYQMFIFPNIVKRFGLINVYRLGTKLTLLLMIIFPFVHLLAVGDSFPRALLYVHRPLLFNVSPSQHRVVRTHTC
eukprot:COSAG01_NODE_9148_length_2537_cov_1.123462_3_plen_262_part_00